MAPCRSILWLLGTLVLVCELAQADEGKGGCVKARSALPSNTAHVDVSTLIKKVKRSAEEGEDNANKDCDEDKKSKVGIIKQSAVSAVPGQNETTKKKSSVTSSSSSSSSLLSSDVHEYLMLPNHRMNVQRNVLGIKRGHLFKTPNVKTVKKSPIWSLSKLIEEVDGTNAKKNATPSLAVTETAKEIHPVSELLVEDGKPAVTKTNVATDPSKGIKATLSKAIEKVEKVIASRNAKLIAPSKTDENQAKRDNGTVTSPDSKSVTFESKTVSTESKEAQPATHDPPIVHDLNKNKTATTAPAADRSKDDKKKQGADPYAEIAAGPDRPKIPELKTGNNDDNEGPVMKMNKGGSKQPSIGGNPLTGQHDVGGLLDRLTDKLNKGAGGIAMDESSQMDGTAAANDVKYIQSPMGSDDSSAAAATTGATGTDLQNIGAAQDKQLQEFGLDRLKDQADHNDMEKMTEQEGMMAGSDAAASRGGLDSLAQAFGGTGSTEQGLARATGDAGLGGFDGAPPNTDTSVADTESDDDGMAKSLSKASSMTTNAIMDVLKSAKIPNTNEYSNADITAGPDPYANEQSEQQTSEPVGSLFNSENSIDAADPNTFSRSNEESEDAATGDSRSLGTVSEDEESYQRNTIPIDQEQEQESRYREPESYRDNYNTEMFKRNIIMRPKIDTYVSPFHDKEAFDTAI